MVAAELFICLTLQAEGCTLELWNAHKGCLKKHFGRIVDEVRAQQREDHENGDQSGQQRPEPPPAAVVHSSCKGDSEGINGSRQGRSISSSTSRVSPTSTLTNARQPALKPITALIASIKSELGLPPATSIFDTISMGMSSLGLAVTDAMTLKDKAIRLAQELGIPVTEGP